MPNDFSSARPSAHELSVWRQFLRTHATIIRRLEQELLDEHNLPLTWYDVLLQLAETPERRLRMTDLADRVLLSRSGLTRLVDKLVKAGLVERQACLSDARGTFTVLTAEGLARLRETASTHLRGIRAHVTSRLNEAELATLAILLTKVLGEIPESMEEQQVSTVPVESTLAPALER